MSELQADHTRRGSQTVAGVEGVLATSIEAHPERLLMDQNSADGQECAEQVQILEKTSPVDHHPQQESNM